MTFATITGEHLRNKGQIVKVLGFVNLHDSPLGEGCVRIEKGYQRLEGVIRKVDPSAGMAIIHPSNLTEINEV